MNAEKNEILDVFNFILQRELQKLEKEILSFPNDESLWKIYDGIVNSAGNLCLHLCGNLQHFIGAGLGDSGYVRNREAEFNSKNISRDALVKEIYQSMTVVEKTLQKISASDLQKIYPLDFQDKKVTIAYLLIHLTSHFSYHLGQINYLRRKLNS